MSRYSSFPQKLTFQIQAGMADQYVKVLSKSLYMYMFILIPHLWYLSSPGTTDMVGLFGSIVSYPLHKHLLNDFQ